MSAPRNTAEAVYMSLVYRWPYHPMPQMRGIIWTWLGNRMPPQPPKLGMDELYLIAVVSNWARQHYPRTAPAKIAQEG